MTQAAAANGSRAMAERRRALVEERLRDVGVARRIAPPDGRLASDERHAERLRDALESLGPVFASFGQYLASRLDLLPRRESIELGKIRNWSPPSPPLEVARQIRRELGAWPGECFKIFDPEPAQTNLLFQEHGAWIHQGVAVVVRVVRPELAGLVERDVPLLDALEPHLSLRPGHLREAIADFALTLERRLDQLGQVDSFVRLAADAQLTGGIAAPVCYREWCTRGVLTMERIDGVAIGYAFQEGAPASALLTSPDRESTVRQLCAAWLRQAIDGRVIPTDFGPHDLVLVPDRVVYVGSGFEPQTADGRARFLSYINAVGVDDPDAACEWVLEECEPRRNEAAEEALKRRFRQAVPFRDGESTGEDNLAEQLLAHWRVALDAGWHVRPHLLHMYQAVHSLAACTAALVPGRDVLMLALHDVRLRIGLNDVRQVLNPAAVPATLDRLLANVVNLPQQIDEVLTRAAEGRLRLKLHMPASEEQRRIRNSTVSLIAGLSVMVSLAFAFRVLVPQPGPIVERVGAVVLLLAGLWLLIAARDL